MVESLRDRGWLSRSSILLRAGVLAGQLLIAAWVPRPALAQSPGSVPSRPATSTAIEGIPTRLLKEQSHPRALNALRAANQLERAESSDCVDRYYEAAVFAYATLITHDLNCGTGWTHAQDLYNQALGDCLRTAGAFGRLDPGSHLQINGPEGPIFVRVVHRGFVWSREDFETLIDVDAAPRNPSQHRSYKWPGLGSAQVVARSNRKRTAADRSLPPRSFFPATAILHPEVGPWVGKGLVPTAQTTDLLELYDPLRTTQVEWRGGRVRLAGNLDAPIAMAEASVESRRLALIGLVNPSVVLSDAALGFVEPYQPGKIPVIFVHGLRDNPYTFTDIVNGLRTCPGFLDQFQIAGYRYPTGVSFVRTAALFRRSLRNMEATYDPQHRDPGLQNSVLVGHSMGGLLIKLQITWSGDALWNLASTQPLDSLVTTESTRTFLRDLFFFEPLPFVRRVVFMGTPHDGAALANRAIGRITSSLVQRSPETRELLEQLMRDNPGAVRPYMAKLPTSIDLLTQQNPILETMRQLTINPHTTYHTIAGTSGLPPAIAQGDSVVPLSSAHSDGAASEVWIPTIHTRMNASPYTLKEVGRILQVHLAETYSTPSTNPLAVRASPMANAAKAPFVSHRKDHRTQ